MPKSTFKKIGDFQADLGKTIAPINKVIGVIAGSLIVCGGIVCFVLAFIPFKSNSNTSPQICDNLSLKCPSGKKCENNKCVDIDPKPPVKKIHYLLAIPGAILCLLGGVIIWMSSWWAKTVKKNRTAAQVEAAGFELGAIKDLFGN